MSPQEANYRVAAVLLRSDAPVTLAEVVEASGVSRAGAMAALDELAEAGDIRGGELTPGQPGPQ